MLSTLHSKELKNTDKEDKQNTPIQKPTCVIEYNRNMVDRSDMMISSVDSLRKLMKWYRKLFFPTVSHQREKKGRPPISRDQPLRLTARHFPSPVLPTPKKQNPTRYCTVCSNTTTGEKKRRESRYMCSECGVTLCVFPCLEKYHTLNNY
ncbi:PiggyBac transposable element-derived protein 4 [Blattella germanica]|nr:PiggyBac transposable element-derived protein 4 [Blattella germanica]